MQTSKRAAINAAHRYSVVLSVFRVETRNPELATGILLDSPRGLLLVTAGHVVQRFLALGAPGRLQIGVHRFTLQSIASESVRFSGKHNVVAINLESSDLDAIRKDALPFNRVASLPVSEGDLVAFVGYPGYWQEVRVNDVGLGSYEFFGPVRTVEPEQFSILIDTTYEIRLTTRRRTSVRLTESLGGLSGAPVFSTARPPLLVGWIYEGHLRSDRNHQLYGVHADAMTASGTWVS